jgi:hypothetical protein
MTEPYRAVIVEPVNPGGPSSDPDPLAFETVSVGPGLLVHHVRARLLPRIWLVVSLAGLIHDGHVEVCGNPSRVRQGSCASVPDQRHYGSGQRPRGWFDTIPMPWVCR